MNILSKNEERIMNCLRKDSSLSVVQIADLTGIHRTNVYDALRALTLKGLVLTVQSQKGSQGNKFMLPQSKDLKKAENAMIEEIRQFFRRFV